MISLERRAGRPLRIGHRGAALLAPENTIQGFRAAIEVGVDLVEFDVIQRRDRELVVAHGLADVGAETPTLEEALRFFAEEAPSLGVHVDLKSTGRELDIVDMVRRFGLAERTLVTSGYVGTSRTIAALGGARVGITIPRTVFSISEDGRSAPFARSGLHALRRVTPALVGPLLRITRATAAVVHHSLVSPATVRAAHQRGAAVVAWTVDEPDLLARVAEAGVDAVVTNDPRIFASTLAS